MFADSLNDQILCGDARRVLATLPDNYFQTCITSPPYFRLRDYGHPDQIGLEETAEEYVQRLVAVFREVRRTLHPSGTLWVVIGDSYNGSGKAGSNPDYHNRHTMFGRPVGNKSLFAAPTRLTGLKPKDLIGIPWRLAFALQESGWYLRQDIIWHKPNPQPSPVRDRCTTAHEYIFLLAKSRHYFFNADAIAEPTTSLTPGHPSFRRGNVRIASEGRKVYSGKHGQTGKVYKPTRNRRSVWTVPVRPTSGPHTATFPPALIRDIVEVATSSHGICVDCGAPFLQPGVAPCTHRGKPAAARILDPFFGMGTTGKVALELNRSFVGVEINPDYVALAETDIRRNLGWQGTLF